MNTYDFYAEVKELAEIITQEWPCGADFESWLDAVHEMCDGHQWVFVCQYARDMCALSVSHDGEEWLEDVYGTSPFDGCETFDDVCGRLAYATMYVHVERELANIIEELIAKED